MLFIPQIPNEKIVLVSNQYIQDSTDKSWVRVRPKVVLKHRLGLNKERSSTQTLCLEYLNSVLPEPPLVPFQRCCILDGDATPHMYIPQSIDAIETENVLLDSNDTDPFQDGSLYAFFTFDRTLSDVFDRHNLTTWNPRWETGKFNECLDLYRQCYPNSPVTPTRFPQFKEGFTISFWLYPYGDYNSRRQGVIQFTESLYEDNENGMGNTRRPYIWLDRDGRKLGISVDLENGVTENLLSNFKLQKRKWSHIALVLYPHSFEVFVNGNIIFTRSFLEKIALTSCHLCVGTVCTRHVKNFRIDQLLIFNRPLSPHEVIYLSKQNTTVSKTFVYYDISNLNLQTTPTKCDIVESREVVDETVNVRVDNNVIVFEQDFNRDQAVRIGDRLCLQLGSEFREVLVTNDNISREVASGILSISVDTGLDLNDFIHVFIIRPPFILGAGRPYIGDVGYSVYDIPLNIISSTITSLAINKHELTDIQQKVLLNQNAIDLDTEVDVPIVDFEETHDRIIISIREVSSPAQKAWIRCRNHNVLTINHVEYLEDIDMIGIIFNEFNVGSPTSPDSACRDFQFRFEILPMGHFVLKGFYIDLMKIE